MLTFERFVEVDRTDSAIRLGILNGECGDNRKGEEEDG
jgi:hypothetical protein